MDIRVDFISHWYTAGAEPDRTCYPKGSPGHIIGDRLGELLVSVRS